MDIREQNGIDIMMLAKQFKLLKLIIKNSFSVSVYLIAIHERENNAETVVNSEHTVR